MPFDYPATKNGRRPPILQQKTAPAGENCRMRREGTSVEVEVTGLTFGFRGANKVPTLARNISARKRAEAELREKTALLEAQVDSSIDGILIMDNQQRRILQNQRCVELWKVPPEILDANEAKQIKFVTARTKNRQRFVDGIRYLHAHPDETGRDEVELVDGTVLDRYSAPVRGKDGRNYGRIWVFRDITARKAAEVALRESEERFKFVARAVSDAVWDWNLTDNSFWWNEGFLTAFGFAAHEHRPSVDSWTNRIHPDDCSRVVESLHHSIGAVTESWTAEYRFQRKDGTYAQVQDRGYILRDDAGNGIRMVGGMRDLTDQRVMEAQYLRAQRMESIGKLAGGISHDLNNVLAPIMMSIELLKLDAGTDARRSKILDIIQISCRRGADLVRQVLSFAQGLDGQRVSIRLRHLIDDLAGIISGTFPRNIRIRTQVPGDLWHITGDPTQLHQVLLNLAVNARDAMPNGGTLIVAAANVEVDAQFAGMNHEARVGPHVLFQVTDSGLGISPEVQARMFEPFFTTKEIGKGTGFGLATVQNVVRNHGGFLNVESEVNRGTTFKIYLPAEPGRRPAEATYPFPADLPHGRGELVLVVDDEYSIRDITQQTLEFFGYRVITASDGAEAVALYAKQAPQIAVVLTDMMMPIMDGAATIQVLTRMNPSVKIIAVSGIAISENIAQANHARTYDFLPKPYNAETLLKRLRDVLDRECAGSS